jgi:hypothetical protein
MGNNNFPTLTAEENDLLLNSWRYLGDRDGGALGNLTAAEKNTVLDGIDVVVKKLNIYLNKKGLPDVKVSNNHQILLPYPELVATRARKAGEALRRGGYVLKKKRKKGYSVKKR